MGDKSQVGVRDPHSSPLPLHQTVQSHELLGDTQS